MPKALERDVAAAIDRIVFLAPPATSVFESFPSASIDACRYQELLGGVQRLRGAILLKEGAIEPRQLTADDRYETPEDEASWHMLLLDRQHRVGACALYLEHEGNVRFDQLRVRNCAMASDSEWRPKLIRAVEGELDRAKREGLRYVELGGWAVSEQSRGTAAPLALALAVYGFSRRADGALGMTTATVRHRASAILQRLGGSRFELDGVTLPPYYEPRYRCFMELLRFDSRRPNEKYLDLINQVHGTLARIAVIARPAGRVARSTVAG
jgi:hypothetical protein